MIPVGPVIPGAEAVENMVAKDQKEYQPLPAFHTEFATISRWRLSDEERAHLVAGGDLFIAQLNFGQMLQPLMPMAAPEDQILPTVLACEDYLQQRNS